MDDEPRYRLDRPRGEPPLSLCMIVKNEERNLGPCLTSAAGLAGGIDMVMPGDNAALVVSLEKPVGIARGSHFAIRKAARRWAPA